MTGKLDALEKLEISSRRQWREWLEKNHGRSEGVWLITWKKAFPAKYTSYEETVEEALCFGWIDSTTRKLNDQQRMLYFCPRRPKSVWSKLNKQRIERLIKNGSMTAAGLARIEEAKRNGSWNALDASDDLEIPTDLAKALSRNRKAKVNFEKFPPGSRKIILQWIASARTGTTRSNRIAITIEKAGKGERAR